MKTAFFTAVRKLEVADVPEPKLQRPDDVLVRIDRVGICGSDIHYFVDGRIGSQILQYPATLGHECAGTILDVGSAVEGLAAGDRVAIDPAIVCGTCDQCRSGRSNTCRNLRFMGLPGEAPGAVAEMSVLPGTSCVPIPESMSMDEAALVEPLSIALYAARMAGAAAGARIAILGAGPIGLSVLLAVKALGPCTVFISDLLDERLEVARRCGADHTIPAKNENAVRSILAQDPPEVDFVFECSGDPACIDQGQRILAPGGTLLMIGIPPTDRVSFDPHRARRAEITFKAVRRQMDCVAPMVRMVSEKRLDPSPLVTHRFPLEEIQEAFELVAGYRDGVIKAMLDLNIAW